MRNLLVVIFVAIPFLVVAQKNKEKRKERFCSMLVGEWVFNEATVKDKQMGDVKLDKWEAVTIHLFEDRTIKIIGPKNKEGMFIETTGTWDVIENGDVLFIKDRKLLNTDGQILNDVKLPIKLTSRRLKVAFPIDIRYPDGYGFEKNHLTSIVWVSYTRRK